ncbi:MAG: hypothetical protein AAF570_08195 [Bacteroidota bacterium]
MRFKTLVLTFFFLLIATFASVAAYQTLISRYGRIDHFWNRTAYENVVEAVKAQNLKPGTFARFYMYDFCDSATMLRITLDELLMRGEAQGLVEARRDADSTLSVWITTADHGHAGRHGYAYSTADTARWDHDRHGENWQLGPALGNGWWMVSFNLD